MLEAHRAEIVANSAGPSLFVAPGRFAAPTLAQPLSGTAWSATLLPKARHKHSHETPYFFEGGSGFEVSGLGVQCSGVLGSEPPKRSLLPTNA